MADARQALEELLGTLGESSRFVTYASLAAALPGLEVQGIGPIGTPITAADAKRLITQATQAPYGRGEETIVDPSVRRVWQIEPDQFALRNTEWNAQLAAIVDVVKEELGIRQKVNAQLYKLLVYEKGSFFAPHRDSEKTPSMFATLVVCLPSRHEGGTLIVKHDGETEKIDFGGEESEFKTQYAAFYADCQHEITPVTSGYRISLVYNLAISGKKQPAAPQNASAVENAAQLLQEIFADKSSNLSKIAIPFEHQYTEAGLDPKQLKGSDRACADVLARAAESLDYGCYVALLTHHQSGAADDSTVDYGGRWGRRRSRRWSYAEDEDEENDTSGVEMLEVYEEELSLEHWLDPQGRKQPFGKIHLKKNELLSPEDMETWPHEQEVHEATGNEGVSVERWYHQGVVVIWPRDRYFSVLAGEGQAAAVPALEQMAARGMKPDVLEACRTFANEIIGHWKPRQYDLVDTSSYPGRMLKLLERIGTPDLAERFMRDILPKDFDGSEGKVLCRLGKQFGWEILRAPVQELLDQQKPDNYHTRLEQIVLICKALCCEPPTMTEERLAVCTSLADNLVNVLERWDKESPAHWYRRDNNRAGIVESVVRIFATIAATEYLEKFLERVLTDKRHYTLRGVLIPDVKVIYSWLADVPPARPAASRLLQHCLTELRAATAHPIEPPKDWTRDAELGCKCQDCVALGKFLRDPAQGVARFPLRKDRRQHLHQQIDAQLLDVTHVTQRTGSPQILVCTKTQASYERRRNQYVEDKKRLAELETLAGGERKPSAKRSSSRRKPKS